MNANTAFAAFTDLARTEPTQKLVDQIRAIDALPEWSKEERMVRAAAIVALRERYPVAVEAAVTDAMAIEADPRTISTAVIGAVAASS